MAVHPFSHYIYCYWFRSQEDRVALKILPIFLIAEECVGLPALIWALWVLYHRYKTGGRVSALVIMLLLCDLLVLFLKLYIVTKLIKDENCWDESSACRIFFSLWSGSLICALHLQPVVALEAVLSLRHPFCSAHFFFPFFSIILSITLFNFFFLFELFEATLYIVLALPLPLTLTVISWIVTCRAPPNISEIPYRSLKPSRSVLAFPTVTVTLYVTVVITCIVLDRNCYVWVICSSLVSMRVISDPLLCVLVYRNDLGDQIQQTPAEANMDIEPDHIQGSDTDTPNTHTAQSGGGE